MKLKLLSSDAVVPTKATDTSAGYDLTSTETYILLPGQRFAFPTGIAVAIPENYYGRIAPRSGLAFKQGIDVLAGVIDSCYRGEIKVILINLGDKNVTVSAGDRIAQIIFEKYHDFDIQVVSELDNTERGEGGFGSTGK